MKKLATSFLLLFAVMGSAFAHNDHGYNLYGQLFGNSTGIGVGFDSRFKTGGILGYSAGLTFTDISYNESHWWFDNYNDHKVDCTGVSIPLEVNAIMGKRASKFEIGLGATVYLAQRNETSISVVAVPVEGIEDDLSEPVYDFRQIRTEENGFRPNVVGAINIGYRLQRKSGFFMKLGLSVLVGNIKCSPFDGVIAIPNICIGYTISHF